MRPPNAVPNRRAEPRVADYVVDADVHVTPPPTFWAEYLSPQFRALAPKVESDDEYDYIVFDGTRRPINLMQSQAGRKFDQNVYASFISDPIGVELRHKPGGKNIMWSSDYPHSETTFPHSHKVIAQNFKGVPQVERDWIIAGCAEKFFGLK